MQGVQHGNKLTSENKNSADNQCKHTNKLQMFTTQALQKNKNTTTQYTGKQSNKTNTQHIQAGQQKQKRKRQINNKNKRSHTHEASKTKTYATYYTKSEIVHILSKETQQKVTYTPRS